VPIELGTLGGTQYSTASSINNRGEVIGGSNLRGNKLFHTFLWTREHGMRDLGTVKGDLSSAPGAQHAINDSTQVVGTSCSTADPTTGLFAGACRASLWQEYPTRKHGDEATESSFDGATRKGIMLDLNTLIPAGSNPAHLHMFMAIGNNNHGDIVGWATTPTGEVHAFLAKLLHPEN
jgi:probable HAF family extracellular repeat protein